MSEVHANAVVTTLLLDYFCENRLSSTQFMSDLVTASPENEIYCAEVGATMEVNGLLGPTYNREVVRDLIDDKKKQAFDQTWKAMYDELEAKVARSRLGT